MADGQPSTRWTSAGSSFWWKIPHGRRFQSNTGHSASRHNVVEAEEAEDNSSRPSIRIRRSPSEQTLNLLNTHDGPTPLGRRHEGPPPVAGGRAAFMPKISETSPIEASAPLPSIHEPVMHSNSAAPRQRPISSAQSAVIDYASQPATSQSAITDKPLPPIPQDARNEYESSMVDFLDVMDPEVSTLSTLTNVQNSLFIPKLGSWLNRRPIYTLTQRPSPIPERPALENDSRLTIRVPERPGVGQRAGTATTLATLNTITSNVNDQYFAVLPHGVSLPGWSLADKQELNDHVRHMLHSRRSKIKRSIKGFGQYVQRPLGLFVTIYATLITLFGTAWVLFLIGWINVGGRQLYVIHVIDLVLVALFAIVGDGLAPFRAVDTYHMIFITHYARLTWRLRKKKALPELQDHNDLPSTLVSDVEDPERFAGEEVSVLSPEQQRKLVHHQKKFSGSHSFYKPHETTTHHAFPLKLLVAIVILLDCHSMFQIALGTCTLAINYKVRPFALTTVILCCSITCNITAGVLITLGDRKTRKKDVVEKMFRQELTAEAMEILEKKREKEREKNIEANVPCIDVPPPLQHMGTVVRKKEEEREEKTGEMQETDLRRKRVAKFFKKES